MNYLTPRRTEKRRRAQARKGHNPAATWVLAEAVEIGATYTADAIHAGFFARVIAWFRRMFHRG